MRVNNSTNPNVQSAQTEGLKKSDQAQKSQQKSRAASEIYSKNATAGTESAKAEISTKARDLANAHAVAAKTPDVREERIAELKKRIAEGKYEVDANKVADKMVGDHMSF